MRFLYLMCAFFFISCDPPVSYQRVVENNSSHAIWLINQDQSGAYCGKKVLDSVLVPSNSSQTIETFFTEFGSRSKLEHFVDCPGLCVDTVYTRIDNNDSLKVTFPIEQHNANWEYRILKSGQNGNGECECKLTITDSDIN